MGVGVGKGEVGVGVGKLRYSCAPAPLYSFWPIYIQGYKLTISLWGLGSRPNESGREIHRVRVLGLTSGLTHRPTVQSLSHSYLWVRVIE